MMNNFLGFCIVTDDKGIILNVVADTAHIFDLDTPGTVLYAWFDTPELPKIIDFFILLKNKHLVFNIEANLKTKSGAQHLFYLSGVKFEENRNFIIGQLQDESKSSIFPDMTKISNEQIARIRELEKENIALKSAEAPASNDSIDALSQLNNELINLQRDLIKKNKELEELNNLRNYFLGMAAHDLKNPSAIIIQFADLLEEEPNLEPKVIREVITHISHTARYMYNLVNDLLDYTALESGKIAIQPVPYSLKKLLDTIIKNNEYFGQRKNIALSGICEPVNATVKIDPQRIEQAVNNLISNAFKFSYPNTEVKVIMELKNNNLIISVVDQGQGIPETEIPNLFIPFRPGKVKSTGGEKSTGLGLSLVKKIAEGHGGKVEVISRTGLGSTFRLVIPQD
ncbi:MAG: hypothetical protein PWR20_901 [Bacteroidales bacterium]|jgi:signal transduction histidine kinase|nr:hypothetical protein [Bacteroidales bacterium]MDN5329874.1 hypothetical protein [Bacteroidales bacterium]